MNELLAWMSARRSGSLPSFRARVASSHTGASGGGAIAPYRLAAWTMSKLAHAEFESAANGVAWRVAPPVLAAADICGPIHAVLCGARSAEVLSALDDSAGPQRMTRLPQPNAPDLIALSAESPSALAGIAYESGIPLQWNASLALLAVCPHVKETAAEERSVPVGGGWVVSRFSRTGLAWVPAAVSDAQSVSTGLFRFRGDYGTTYVLKENGRALSCDPAVAKYRILGRRHRPLAYDAAVQELAIAASCRPPEIIERALIVGSGRLPQYRDRTLVYTRVGRATAKTVAILLRQRLR